MRITILTENFKKYLGVVNKGISSRPSLPILSGVLLRANEEGFSIVSTDLEIGFWVKARAKVEEEGELVVPAKLLFELVASLPLGTMVLETEGDKLRIAAGKVKTEILGQPAGDFPSIPKSKSIQVEINTGEFSNVVSRVAVSAAKDDTRPVLTGVLWQFSEDGVGLAATDGYRLSVDKIKLDKKYEGKETKLILPARSLLEVSKVASEMGAEKIGVEFDKENQQVVFVLDEIEVSSRLVSGEFPPYQQIMPNTYKTRIFFEKGEFTDAVKRAKLFARDNANIVKLEVIENTVVVKAESSQIGNNSNEVEAEVEGEKLTVAFNAQYLLDYLNICDDKKITWETEGDLKPSVFRSTDPDWVQVVMPVRIQN